MNTERINQLKTNILADLWKKYQDMPSKTFKELHERDTKQINELINDLAIERAKNEILEKK